LNFPGKVCDDLRTTILPPGCRGLDDFAVVETQRIRKVIITDFGLIEVGGVWRFRIAVGSPPQRRNMQQIQSPLMILFGGQMSRRRKAASSRRVLAKCRGRN